MLCTKDAEPVSSNSLSDVSCAFFSLISYYIIFNLLNNTFNNLTIMQYKIEQDNQAYGALIVAQKTRPSKSLSMLQQKYCDNTVVHDIQGID